ncbi:MAG: Npt1/Npt2 family nucleotide transporter [Zetaproteobacteria bacterium]|nr:Npt1/Npt2 family nucleotide transporter [Zetaproteobacteria bacterium]
MVSKTENQAEFGKWRQLLFPIHGYELQKFIPLAIMFIFVGYNYSVLRIVKDSLVVNAPGSGAEAIPYLKLWGTLPAAILASSIYIKLGTMLSRKALFYATLAPFVLFYFAFNYFIYPNIDVLHPTTSADWLESVLPAGLKGMVAMYRNWSYSLFYILSELWGSIVMAVLFWSTANETCKTSEAKRFYGLLMMASNVLLGTTSSFISYANRGSWDESMSFICNFVVVSGILLAAFYWYLNEVVMKKPQFMIVEKKTKKKSKVKLGFAASMKELAKSRYLALLAMIILCYGVSINLIEVTWKHNVKVLFAGDKQAFLHFQSMCISVVGPLTAFFLFFGSANFLRIFGWRITALITPVILLVTGALFFANLTFSEYMTGILATIGTTPLFAAAWIGLLQNSITKAGKYAFFDTTKETAYIPLDPDVRRTGKAAIDGVGSRLGKSGGSVINMALIAMVGSIDAVTPYVAIVTLGIGIVWFVCVNKLAPMYEELVSHSREETAEADSTRAAPNATAPSKA